MTAWLMLDQQIVVNVEINLSAIDYCSIRLERLTEISERYLMIF
jgi:hypothetical protein